MAYNFRMGDRAVSKIIEEVADTTQYEIIMYATDIYFTGIYNTNMGVGFFPI